MQEQNTQFTKNLFNGTKNYSNPEPLSQETVEYLLKFEKEKTTVWDWNKMINNPIATYETIDNYKAVEYGYISNPGGINPDVGVNCLEYLSKIYKHRTLDESKNKFHPDPKITWKCIEWLGLNLTWDKEGNKIVHTTMNQTLNNKLIDFFNKKG